MKDHFGTDFSAYTQQDISRIQDALKYEFFLFRIFIAWNILFMAAGVLYVYFNFYQYTTNEMLWVLAMFWGVSGLPCFLLRDLVKARYAEELPDPELKRGLNPALTLLKLIAGFFFGAWATHVMLIWAITKYFELKEYSRELCAA